VAVCLGRGQLSKPAQERESRMVRQTGSNQRASPRETGATVVPSSHTANGCRSRVKAGISRKAGETCAAVQPIPHKGYTKKNNTNNQPSSMLFTGYFFRRKAVKARASS